ncbi:MAG: proteasome endopeptidase complex, archaeal, beta subunit [Candidatus Altiarchaeales archaeon ex4484_2]|nr:MAG: proteasome endopeptidase complex, archaeal, beta subunit [Candidatus Altiarchaeales archaeon ex4484_2]
MESKNLKGTTTIGLTCSDGIVLVADRRASWGTFVASKRAEKIFKLNNQVGASVAGSVGDAESLIRLIQAEAALFEMNNKKTMSPKAIATLLSNILQGSKYFPYMVQLLIAGMNVDRPQLYTLDPVGGLTQEDYASSGSGSPMAYGVLEQEYSSEKTVQESIAVAIKAINSAMSRDTATGNGINLVTITKDEFRSYDESEIKNLIEEK